jgi:hypothetical protein
MPAFVQAQESEEFTNRGSIPSELLRPGRGESPRYPVDTVIGALGRGKASDEAYSFARSVAAGLLTGNMDHAALASVNSVLREGYLSALEQISPRTYRIGGGREEADGAYSFLVRFIGKDQGITGELFIRFVTRIVEEKIEDTIDIAAVKSWIFEELILEEVKNRGEEQKETLQRFDFSPYERFF